ncbi:hypothetical protein D3C84_621470 [compost metagenome]
MVDFTGELDETSVQAIFAGFPRQVEGIDGNTVATQARARVVGSETERLGRGSVDHFKDIDAHTVGNDLHLVDQTDVDGTVDVFQQLGHFRSFG